MSLTPALQALSPPGLVVFPGYTARAQECLIIKENKKHFVRGNSLVSFKDAATGGPGKIFMEIDEGKDKLYHFIDAASAKEIFAIKKEEHTFKPDVYHALSAGKEIWNLSVAEHMFSSDEYTLTLFLGNGKQLVLQLQKKVQGQARAVMLNGAPVVTMDEPHRWSHLRREDVVYVAAGMDIAVAIGVAWCHYDKQSESRSAAAGGAAAGAAGGGGA